MFLVRVVLLIQYSNEKIGFRKIKLHLTSKIDFEIWKCPTFDDLSSSYLTRCISFSGCWFGCKSPLNFNCLCMKFHNRGHFTARTYYWQARGDRIFSTTYYTWSRIYLKWTRLNRHHEVRIQTCHFHLHAMRGAQCEFALL